MRRSSFKLAPLLLSFGLLLTACQSGDSSSTVSPGEPSTGTSMTASRSTSGQTTETVGVQTGSTGTTTLGGGTGTKQPTAPPTTASPPTPTTAPTTAPVSDPEPQGLWDSRFWISTGNGWYGETEEEMRRIIRNHKELGFNSMERIRLTKDFLDICAENKMYVTTGYMGEKNSDGKTRTEQDIKEWAEKFSYSPYFLGFIPWDEPAYDTEIFQHVNQQYKWYRKYDPDRLFMVNLLPSYGAYTWGNGEFAKYISDFDKIADLPILGVDFYPFDKNGYADLNTTAMWRDWGYCRKLCVENDRDLWLYIQGTGWGEEISYWTKGRIAVQMNAAIAFGARRVSYWVSTPLYMDASGNKSSLYEAGKDIHTRAQITGDYLLHKTPDKIYMSGIAAARRSMYYLDDETQSNLISALPDGASIVSTFKDGSRRTYLLVVNRSYESALNSAVKLKSAHKVSVLDSLTGKEKSVGNSVTSLPVQLQAGEMVLYIVE